MTRTDPPLTLPNSTHHNATPNNPASARPFPLRNGPIPEERPDAHIDYRDGRSYDRPPSSEAPQTVTLPGVNSLFQPLPDLPPPPAGMGQGGTAQINGQTHSSPSPFDFSSHHSAYSGRSSPHAPNSHPFDHLPTFPSHFSSHPRQEHSSSYPYPTLDRPDRSAWPRTPQTTSPQTPANQFEATFSPQPPGPSSNTLDQSSYVDEASNTGDESGTDSAIEANVPRFVRSETVPNEGEIYIYDDGSRCPARIDGELVNQRWGITKAGKPRKRLALACLTCREKKIKCEPGEPRCVQCEKTNKECRIRPARGQQPATFIAYPGQDHPTPDSPSSSDATYRPSAILLPKSAPDPSSPKPPKRQSTPPNDQWGSSKYPRDSHWTPPIISRDSGYKKRRQSSTSLSHSYQDSASTAESYDPSIDSDNTESRPTTKNGFTLEMDPPKRDPLVEEWSQDPYERDPKLVLELMELYLNHVNSALPCFFPQGPLISWIKNTRGKIEASLMLVYAILAVACQFRSDGAIGHHFANIAKYAESRQRGRFSLQLVQTRLLLLAYHFSTGDMNQATEYCGQATTAAFSLELNLEPKEQPSFSEPGYLDLSASAYLECRRRTFWSVYCMSRLCGNLNGRASHSDNGFITIKLPQDNQSYELHLPNRCPSFASLNRARGKVEATEFQHFGPLAHFVLMCTIWGDILTNVFHVTHDHTTSDDFMFERFHLEITERLETWSTNLPEHLTFASTLPLNSSNLDQAIRSDYAVQYMAMHALHSTTVITLRRYGQLNDMRQMRQHTLIQEAVRQARIWLALVQAFATSRTMSSYQSNSTQMPFVGFATMTAIDVISAKGRISEIDDLVRSIEMVLPILDDMAQFWNTARIQAERVRRRLGALRRARTFGSTNNEVSYEEVPGAGRCFSMETPIDGASIKEFDVLYMTSLGDYFEAIGRVDNVRI
ncbi:MAG: hypothetical protein M1814_004236 [Vezdaea aestivalis]|nr:MAG: hypothetical protein M1814_004236 [Vezdaea aestivalis]